MSTFKIEPRYDADNDEYTIALRRAVMEKKASPDLYAACVADLLVDLDQFVGRKWDDQLRNEIAQVFTDWITEKGERYDVG